MKRKIVLSGVNMVEGGILTVYRNLILAFSKIDNIEVICLVHDIDIFKDLVFENIIFYEYRNIKSSWLKRLFFEYVTSYKISKEIKPELWFSLHDMSSRVDCPRQYVYCHNPSPFYHASLKEFTIDKKFYLFTLFYKYLYKINIKKNKAVVVQQSWIADSFASWFSIRNLIIARAENISVSSNKIINRTETGRHVFIYPAIPRVFKNFDILLNALQIIRTKHSHFYGKFSVILTFDYSTNLYAKKFIDKCQMLNEKNIYFIGYKTKDELSDIYLNGCDYLIFPSKLETWGLPLSEAKEYQIPILAADLPYAHETIGCYDKAAFFDANNAEDLASNIVNILMGNKVFQRHVFLNEKNQYQTAVGWDDLVAKILD